MDTHIEPISLELPISALQAHLQQTTPQLDSPFYGERDRSRPHVTELINIAKPYDGPHFEGLGDMGLLFELALRPFMATWAKEHSLFYIPGSIQREKDGIIGSLDGLLLGKGIYITEGLPGVQFGAQSSEIRVADTKLKFSATKELPFSNRAQMKAYCYMVGATQAVLPVGRITSRPPAVSLDMVTLTFDEIELVQNWQMILHALEQWRPPDAG